MTNPELAAAAKVVNHWLTYLPNDDIPPYEEIGIVNRHVMAQQDAEDDLPVTEEWLRSIGLNAINATRDIDSYICHFEVCRYGVDHLFLPIDTNRREVKQILKALGITTKGTAHE